MVLQKECGTTTTTSSVELPAWSEKNYSFKGKNTLQLGWRSVSIVQQTKPVVFKGVSFRFGGRSDYRCWSRALRAFPSGVSSRWSKRRRSGLSFWQQTCASILSDKGRAKSCKLDQRGMTWGHDQVKIRFMNPNRHVQIHMKVGHKCSSGVPLGVGSRFPQARILGLQRPRRIQRLWMERARQHTRKQLPPSVSWIAQSPAGLLIVFHLLHPKGNHDVRVHI